MSHKRSHSQLVVDDLELDEKRSITKKQCLSSSNFTPIPTAAPLVTITTIQPQVQQSLSPLNQFCSKHLNNISSDNVVDHKPLSPPPLEKPPLSPPSSASKPIIIDITQEETEEKKKIKSASWKKTMKQQLLNALGDETRHPRGTVKYIDIILSTSLEKLKEIYPELTDNGKPNPILKKEWIDLLINKIKQDNNFDCVYKNEQIIKLNQEQQLKRTATKNQNNKKKIDELTQQNKILTTTNREQADKIIELKKQLNACLLVIELKKVNQPV